MDSFLNQSHHKNIIIPDEFDSILLTKALEAFDEDKIIDAKAIIDECRQVLMNDKNMLDFINNLDAVKQIDEFSSELNNFLMLLKNDDGWIEIDNSESEKIQILYRPPPCHGPGCDLQTIKCHMDMDTHIFNALAVVGEIDLVPSWFTILKTRSTVLGHISRFRKCAHLHVHLPWPLANRDIVMDGRGVDMLDKGQIAVIVKPFTKEITDMFGIEEPVLEDDTVRMLLKNTGFLFTLLSPDLVHVDVAVAFDPKMQIVPMSIIDWFARHLTGFAMKAFRKQAMQYEGSVYEERVHSQPYVYDIVKTKVDLFFHNRNFLK